MVEANAKSAAQTAAWQLVQDGELAAAREAFEHLRPNARVEALSGLLALAAAQSDGAQLGALLAELRPEDPAELLLRAAAAGLVHPRLYQPTLALLARTPCRSDVAPRLTASVQARRAWLTDASLRGRPRRVGLAPGSESAASVKLAALGSVPLVLLSVNGAAEVPFVVDTGASVSVLNPEYARRLGIAALPGTQYSLNSPAGWLETGLARVQLRLGDMEVSDAVALLDLPLPGVAGILSPQSTLRDYLVALSFRDWTLRVSQHGPGPLPVPALPLVLGDGRPQLRVAGPAAVRFFTLDTGAEQSWMAERFSEPDHGGTLLDSQMHHAGGGTSRLRRSQRAIDLLVAGIPWRWQQPSLGAEPMPTELRELESAGVIGMDFAMGRDLYLDPAHARLGLSQRAELCAWPVGARAEFVVEGTCFPEPQQLVETVVARDADAIRLRLELRAEQALSVELELEDSWQTRGGFLATRARRAARCSEAELEHFWQRVFVPFRPSSRASHSRCTNGQLAGRSRCCTEILVEVRTPRGPALLAITSLPDDPWRVCHVELRARSGEVLWRFRRQGFQPAA